MILTDIIRIDVDLDDKRKSRMVRFTAIGSSNAEKHLVIALQSDGQSVETVEFSEGISPIIETRIAEFVARFDTLSAGAKGELTAKLKLGVNEALGDHQVKNELTYNADFQRSMRDYRGAGLV